MGNQVRWRQDQRKVPPLPPRKNLQELLTREVAIPPPTNDNFYTMPEIVAALEPYHKGNRASVHGAIFIFL